MPDTPTSASAPSVTTMREMNGLDGGAHSTSNTGEKLGQWMRDEAAFMAEADGEVMIDEVGLDYDVENARVLTSTTRARDISENKDA
ncbi:hypothetical protein ARMGADRAFT_1091679 [Armillaria gallica]|uniref:Uncharacterized protein n=1 Tax=Armillaria gallica TaxID=47427 RepID=A0A2H3D0J0_ARMGA|nr:hypothetical protein ARMGADRAFT_1091679 [Armillaria gallica]